MPAPADPSEPFVPPTVLVVADRDRVSELAAALAELPVEILVSSGGDDTIDLFEARRPIVVVLTASLAVGDARSLIVTMRGMVKRAEVAIVVVGDEVGPIRTALDALDLAPDRFVTRPLSARALRFAVAGGIDAVKLTKSSPQLPPPPLPVAMGTIPGIAAVEDSKRLRTTLPGTGPRAPIMPLAEPVVPVAEATPVPTKEALRARWAALADSMADEADDDDDGDGDGGRVDDGVDDGGRVGDGDGVDDGDGVPAAATDAASGERTRPVDGVVDRTHRITAAPDDRTIPLAAGAERTTPTVAAGEHSGLYAVTPEHPAPSELAGPPARPSSPWDEPGEPEALPTPVVIKPRRKAPDDTSSSGMWKPGTTDELPPVREPTLILREPPPATSRTETGDGHVVVAARTSSDEIWSDPEPMQAIPEHAHADELHADELAAPAGSADEVPNARQSGPIGDAPPRDFARELRAKMTQMAQRLFQGGDAAPADHAPRHDHTAEIDLSGLGDEPALNDAEPAAPGDVRDAMTSPGSWDSQVRERGLPDTGALVRGVSDAAMLLAKMFASGATGRVGFRRDDVETVVYFDHGRPVFASSNEPRDRMGELLAREGKITATQYERCQKVVAESGRRMGEILVDFGYLKRRELLPAVRRHVEDLIYSLFGWERGTYYVVADSQPSAERIRLSRHPASLILEGIRRKLDRTSLDKLVGPPSTVIEVRDRERLGGIINLGDLAAEERAALTAFDGQADLAHVARVTGVDLADVLPLAWGLCVLGLATARRTDTDVADDTTALVGETDLAIDRERVRARWQLVTDADYFALLGVRRDATAFEIRRAYQSARKDFAADCFPVDLRRELARELDDIAHVLDEAFRVLRDDQLRVTYLSNLFE